MEEAILKLRDQVANLTSLTRETGQRQENLMKALRNDFARFVMGRLIPESSATSDFSELLIDKEDSRR